MLVAVGSALFTVLSAYAFGAGSDPNIDPTRIAAQIVSGIGFLGAGAILKDGIVIRGLTILVSLWPINALAERLHGTAAPEVQLRLSMEHLEALGNVTSILVSHRLEIGQISTQRLGKESFRADLAIRGRTSSVIASAIAAVDELEGVDIISTSSSD